jgi:quercetin dioxygenase-like cupin family protein
MKTTSSSGSFGELAADEPWPGVRRRSFDAAGATVTRYEFEPGAVFPTHRHPQEQITLVEEGSVRFTVDGVPETLVAGDWSVVAPDLEHGMQAGADGARFVAIVVPRRADRDAYTVVDGGSA